MIGNWEQFRALARDWITEGQARDPRLPVPPEAFVAAAYGHWLKHSQPDGERRTLSLFEDRLKQLYGDEGAVPSLFRKLKGSIRPRGDELERLLVTLFLQPRDESRITPSDRSQIEPFARQLAERLLKPAVDLIVDKLSVRIMASRDSMILGPDSHLREETFGELMSRRLHEASNLPGEDHGVEIPHMLWVLDVSALENEGESAFRARRALLRLTSALMSVLARPLSPPYQQQPTDSAIEFCTNPSAELPTDIELSWRDQDGQADNPEDLRGLLRRTSAVCIVGLKIDAPKCKFKLKGVTDRDFFKKTLLPDTLPLDIAPASDTCLGTKIDIAAVADICRHIPDNAETLGSIMRDMPLDISQYVYTYKEKPGDGPGKFDEIPLDRERTLAAIKYATLLVLVAAAARLTEKRGREPLNDGTVGIEANKLLLDYGARILTIDEFLDFKSWFLDTWNPSNA